MAGALGVCFARLLWRSRPGAGLCAAVGQRAAGCGAWAGEGVRCRAGWRCAAAVGAGCCAGLEEGLGPGEGVGAGGAPGMKMWAIPAHAVRGTCGACLDRARAGSCLWPARKKESMCCDVGGRRRSGSRGLAKLKPSVHVGTEEAHTPATSLLACCTSRGRCSKVRGSAALPIAPFPKPPAPCCTCTGAAGSARACAGSVWRSARWSACLGILLSAGDATGCQVLPGSQGEPYMLLLWFQPSAAAPAGCRPQPSTAPPPTVSS